MINHRLAITYLAALAISFCPHAQAATITWSTPTTINADTDVNTSGTLVRAFNIGDTGVTSTTINGVTFDAFPIITNATSATIGNFNLSLQGNAYSTNTEFGTPNQPFASLSNAYRALLQSGTFDDQFGGIMNLTLNSLTIGDQYSFQFWINNAGNFTGTPQFVTATAGNAVTLHNNTGSNAPGGVGQFATGTFTADSTNQVIGFTSDDYAELNAFQLRSVPEPSSLLITAVSSLALLRRRR